MKKVYISFILMVVLSLRMGYVYAEKKFIPPPPPGPHDDWEYYSQLGQLIVVLDEIIESDFAFTITTPKLDGDESGYEITPYYKLKIRVKRILKSPSHWKQIIEETNECLVFSSGQTQDVEKMKYIDEDKLLERSVGPYPDQILIIRTEGDAYFPQSPPSFLFQFPEEPNFGPVIYRALSGSKEDKLAIGIETYERRYSEWEKNQNINRLQ